MVEEFRQAPDSRQNGAPRALSGGRLAALLAVVALLLATIAWFRWERPRTLVDGVPIPRFARIEPAPAVEPPPGEGCRVLLRLAESEDAAVPGWRADLLAGGWEALGQEEGGERLTFRSGSVRLRVGVEPIDGGDATRLRLTFRPCPDALIARGDPRVVVADP